jgi:hypothetical protein
MYNMKSISPSPVEGERGSLKQGPSATTLHTFEKDMKRRCAGDLALKKYDYFASVWKKTLLDTEGLFEQNPEVVWWAFFRSLLTFMTQE